MFIRTEHVKVSKRGAFIAVFGVVYILLGWSYLNLPAEAKPLVAKSFHLALRVAPLEFYAWAWIATGTIALLGGLVHRLDFLAFGVGVFMPALWSLIEIIEQIHDHVPRAWVAAVIYGLLAIAVSFVAGMNEPLDDPATVRGPWIGHL